MPNVMADGIRAVPERNLVSARRQALRIAAVGEQGAATRAKRNRRKQMGSAIAGQ